MGIGVSGARQRGRGGDGGLEGVLGVGRGGKLCVFVCVFVCVCVCTPTFYAAL